MPTKATVTELLRRFSGGDRAAAEIFLGEILPHLDKIAVRELRRERYAPPISPTELINEVWVRNLGKGGWPVKDRHHFFALAARAMRHVLVDLARKRLSQVRGDGIPPMSLTGLRDHQLPSAATPEQIVRIDVMMDRLSASHPEEATIVDMHYFTGWTFEEISHLTGLPLRRVRYLWDTGRAWLGSQLSQS